MAAEGRLVEAGETDAVSEGEIGEVGLIVLMKGVQPETSKVKMKKSRVNLRITGLEDAPGKFDGVP